MWLPTVILVASLVFLWKLWSIAKPGINLDHIPGPTEHPIWSLIRGGLDPTKLHLVFAALAKTYGPIMKIPRLGLDPMVAVNDFESLHQVFVKLGKEAGGRVQSQYRFQMAFDNTGIVANLEPDEKWKQLRKIAQRHLKQFGEGLSRLETGINTVAESMLDEFSLKAGSPYDPRGTIFSVSLQTVVYLLIGSPLESDHPLVTKLKEYEANFFKFVSLSAPIHYTLLDFVPFLRHPMWPGYKPLLRHRQLANELWEMIKDISSATDSESITQILQSHISSTNKDNISDVDAKQSALLLLFAGVTTTTATFYCAVNILAHNADVQDKLFKEIDDIAGKRIVQLKDRSSMPYTQATLLEINRFVSVSPYGAGHQACSDITVKGYHIPKGTMILTNLWFLHHDAEFWGDPEVFRPERFLGDDGKVVPVDHPRRQHLMPFGAGTRVCVGESFALARLFLWLATTAQRFEILPTEANTKWKTETKNYRFEGNLSSPEYQVIFKAR